MRTLNVHFNTFKCFWINGTLLMGNVYTPNYLTLIMVFILLISIRCTGKYHALTQVINQVLGIVWLHALLHISVNALHLTNGFFTSLWDKIQEYKPIVKFLKMMGRFIITKLKRNNAPFLSPSPPTHSRTHIR